MEFIASVFNLIGVVWAKIPTWGQYAAGILAISGVVFGAYKLVRSVLRKASDWIERSQRRLSEADFRRYASEFFHLEVGATYHDMSSWPEANRLPPMSLELRGQHRGGSHREVDGKPVPTIPVFAMVYVRDIALDDAPVAMLEAEEPRPEIVLFHAGSGAGTAAGRNIRLATEDSLPPGAHVLTGRVEIVVKRGAHSWREGANEEAPVILSRQEAFRVTFEVPSR